jgi:hypothetical protein
MWLYNNSNKVMTLQSTFFLLLVLPFYNLYCSFIMRITGKLLCVATGLLALSTYVTASNTPDVYGDIHVANE